MSAGDVAELRLHTWRHALNLCPTTSLDAAVASGRGGARAVVGPRAADL